MTLQPFRDKCEPIFLFSVVSIIFIVSNVLLDSNLQLKNKLHCKITMELSSDDCIYRFFYLIFAYLLIYFITLPLGANMDGEIRLPHTELIREKKNKVYLPFLRK